MEEFTAIDSGVNGYKWCYRFYKKSLLWYKAVVTRTWHNNVLGVRSAGKTMGAVAKKKGLLGDNDIPFPICSFSAPTVEPPLHPAIHSGCYVVEPHLLLSYTISMRLGASPTRSATYIYICILFMARPAPSRHVPFVCNPSIRPFSVYFLRRCTLL